MNQGRGRQQTAHPQKQGAEVLQDVSTGLHSDLIAHSEKQALNT